MKKIFILIGIVILAAALVFSGVLPLDLFNADTDTVSYTAYGNSNTPTRGIASPEFCDEENIVTSWKADANSIKLSFEGNMYINECSWAGTRSETPMYYYYVVSMDTGNGWDEILWMNDYDQSIVHWSSPTGGHPGKPFEFSEGDYYDRLNTIGGGKYPVYDQNGEQVYSTHRGCTLSCSKIYPNLQTVSIELIGPYVGKLKVELWGLFDCEWNDPGLYSRLLLKDEVNLLPGAGSIDIDTSTTVFEEGENVPILIDTGFSGKTIGGSYGNQGWEVRIYEPDSGSAIKTYSVPDNRENYLINYQVPSGAYNPNGNNQYTIKLWNTLLAQAEEEVYFVGEGMSDDGPLLPSISFDKMSYEKGDQVTVTVSADGNPDGKGTVYEFYVKSYYGNSEVQSVSSSLPRYIPASGGSAQFSFIANRADVYVTVEATAFDADHGSGGLPSETREVTVYLKDADPDPDDDIAGMELSDFIVIVLILSLFSITGIFLVLYVHPALGFLIIVLGVILAFLYWAYSSGALMSWLGG
jgi:hypothetical protein